MSGGGLDGRLAALARAAELGRGRLPDAGVATAERVVERAGQRLRHGLESTVVALAGPTGAGKSTLFNALAGAQVVDAGRRRPTTATATAATWGGAPDALLDWLEVPRRHRVADGDGRLDGLVLLDLPDFDSVERAHRLEVDRVVGLADLLVWVVDPQKYADAAWHERYLRPLAGHAATMAVALNQADLLDDEAQAACRADLERLLRADGLDGLRVRPVSAATGEGLDALEDEIAERVRRREAAVQRLAADVRDAAGVLAAACDGRPGSVGRGERARVVAALAEAAGVPTVVRAVDRAHRRRGALTTGWPVVRWVRRLRPDPLRRLRLADRTGEGPEGRAAAVPSLPRPTPVQEAQVSSAARALARAAAGDLAAPWPDVLRTAATRGEEQAADRLGAAVADVDLRMTRPRWWALAGALQVALAALAAIGALWLVLLAGLGWLRIDDVVPTPEVGGVAVPTLALAVGVVGGLLVALLSRIVTGFGARRRARAAKRRLDARVAAVADELVVEPVRAELAAREEICQALAAAAAPPGRRESI